MNNYSLPKPEIIGQFLKDTVLVTYFKAPSKVLIEAKTINNCEYLLKQFPNLIVKTIDQLE